VGTHLTNKTYTDFTYAPTIHNLTVNAVTGRVVYQERHADEAVTVTQDANSADNYGFFIGQERSSVSINASGHLIITM
jgi:hypothetical protein